jgi:Ca2+-binding EF-hand superfamily protein
VVSSKSNVDLPKGARGYFDDIPAIRRVKDGEFDCILSLQPIVSTEVDEHEERVRKRFKTFPFFVPSAAAVKARSRQKPDFAAKVQPWLKKDNTSSGSKVGCPAFETLLEAAQAKDQADQAKAAAARFKRIARSQTQCMGNDANCGTVHNFMKWTVEHHNNLVALWRKLDKDGSMVLRKHEFVSGLKGLHYPADLQKLWDALDIDQTGTISFIEFAPQHAMDLARVKQWAVEGFGSVSNLFKNLDTDGNKRVTLKEFQTGCVELGLPKRLHESIEFLFELLEDPDDTTSRGSLSEGELSFLDTWDPPFYLTEKADMAAAMALRQALIGRHHGNSLKAWRLNLDRDGSMKVGPEEFIAACKRLARQGVSEAEPPCGIASMYCGLDTDRSGWFTFRDWDVQTHRLLHTFVDSAREECGKVSDFIRAHEKKKHDGLTCPQFRKGIRKMVDIDSDDAWVLYFGLLNQGHKLHSSDVLFLDKWNPDLELEEDAAWNRIAEGHRATITMEE